MFSLKCCAFQTIRSAVSRKNAVFPFSSGRGRPVPPSCILPFAKVKTLVHRLLRGETQPRAAVHFVLNSRAFSNCDFFFIVNCSIRTCHFHRSAVSDAIPAICLFEYKFFACNCEKCCNGNAETSFSPVTRTERAARETCSRKPFGRRRQMPAQEKKHNGEGGTQDGVPHRRRRG